MSHFTSTQQIKKEVSKSKDIVIFYHAHCSDGFGGAYAAWKKFSTKAEYIPLEHNQLLLVTPKDREVYFIDIIATEPTLSKLIRTNKRVTAIDHHVSVAPLVKKTQNYLYALDHSGSTLAWQYFHPGKKTPKLLLHLEDGDLWRLKMPFTKEIYAVLETRAFDFKVWDRFVALLENQKDAKKIIEQGKLLLSYQKELIADILSDGKKPVLFEGHKTYAVNSPVFHSEIGAALAKKYPPIAIVWSEKNDLVKVSLRSNGTVDVSKLAARFGGGGHRAASGFAFKADGRLPWKRIKS